MQTYKHPETGAIIHASAEPHQAAAKNAGFELVDEIPL